MRVDGRGDLAVSRGGSGEGEGSVRPQAAADRDLLLLIVIECIRVAISAKDIAGSIIAGGMGCLIGFQTFINIGVVTGLLPNTGLPLPFVSYGLTSLVSLLIGMGFVMNVRLQTPK